MLLLQGERVVRDVGNVGDFLLRLASLFPNVGVGSMVSLKLQEQPSTLEGS